MPKLQPAPHRSPWFFVPTLYFQQGLPVILVQQFSVLLYKKLGVPNASIAFWTSLLAWPWIVKMLWGPLVDARGSKRAWTLALQSVLVVLLAATTAAVGSTVFFPVTLVLLGAMAFASATHDIACDGFYLVALPHQDQAFFLGISNACFRLAWVFCTGVLVVAAGLLERRGWGVAAAWRGALGLATLVYGAATAYSFLALPRPGADRPAVVAAAPDVGTVGRSSVFGRAFSSFFAQPGAVRLVLFILFYRFGESMLGKMTGLFFLDPRSNGGLGFDAVQTGTVLGSFGVVSLVAGGVLGGAAIARFGLRACLWPMALLMHVPNLMYVWAAAARPGPAAMTFVATVDQFAYGFGLASYMVYTMRICQRSAYRASHYAIATGLMALGAMFAGIASGFIQAHFGWFWFFASVCAATVPGLFLLGQLPHLDVLDHAPDVSHDHVAGLAAQEPTS